MSKYNFDNKDRERSLWSFIAAIFSFIAATLTFMRHTILNIVMLGFIALIFFAISSVHDLNTPQSENNELASQYKAPSILYLNLHGALTPSPLPTKGLDAIQRHIDESLNKKYVHSLLTIEKALDKALDDKNIELVVLDLTYLEPTSLANTMRISQKLKALRENGKKIYSFALNYNQSSYAIAKECSLIFLDPFGLVDIKGISLDSLYYKDLIDKAHITPYIFKAGHFKSAVEPFVLNAMSDDVKEQSALLVKDMWDVYKEQIASRQKLNGINLLEDTYSHSQRLSKYNFDIASMQKDLGLVDHLQSYYFYKDKLIQTYGASPTNAHEPNLIDYRDYIVEEHSKDANIAVIYGIGTITEESQYANTFAPDNIVPQIEKALHDDNIKALVLYIDSPGGSAFASEDIRRALVKFRAHKKVVISMNSVAASGGYWVSTQSDAIFATQDTLVGSIGVFAISFGAHNLLNKYGIYADGVANSDFANSNIASPMSLANRNIIQSTVDNTYNFFLKIVSKARSLDINNAKDFAEGRVFSTKQALKLGLIDKVGSLHDAIDHAATIANINKDDIKVEHYLNSANTGIAFIDDLVVNAIASSLPIPLAKMYLDYQEQSFLKSVMLKKEPSVLAISYLKGIEY